jgi:hypothetical protein
VKINEEELRMVPWEIEMASEVTIKVSFDFGAAAELEDLEDFLGWEILSLDPPPNEGGIIFQLPSEEIRQAYKEVLGVLPAVQQKMIEFRVGR